MIEETERQRMLVDAFNHLQSAIELLDQAAAPGNIAAHLDLAMHQLQGALTPLWIAGAQSIGC
jgi:TPR repeat protein